MFFFFVGGLEQQVSRVLKERAGRCVMCGSHADLVELDKVLRLFFVPVWRWPAGEPAMRCTNCAFVFPRSVALPPSADGRGEEPPATAAALPPLHGAPPRCHSCDRAVDRSFRFCPFCGTAL